MSPRRLVWLVEISGNARLTEFHCFSHSSNQTTKKSSDVRRLEGQSVLRQHHQRQAVARRKEIKSSLEPLCQ